MSVSVQEIKPKPTRPLPKAEDIKMIVSDVDGACLILFYQTTVHPSRTYVQYMEGPVSAGNKHLVYSTVN